MACTADKMAEHQEQPPAQQQQQEQQQQPQQWDGKLSFDVKVEVPFHSEFLEIDASQHTIDIHFQPGKQVFESEPFQLGTLYTAGGHKLTGYLSFGYNYDEKEGEVTIAGTDFPSAQGMALITTPVGIDEHCILRASNAGFMVEEGYDNRIWNCHSQLLAEAKTYLTQLVRRTNEDLIEALNQHPSAAVVVRHVLPSFAPEEYRALCSVWGGGFYLGTLDEVADRTRADAVTIPESDFEGTARFKRDAPFANVVFSNCDGYVRGSGSWIRLWEKYYGTKHVCASQNIPFPCTPDGKCLGGHVVSGKTAKVLAEGSDKALIIPICTKHNNNDGNFMVARREQRVVQLKNYMVRKKNSSKCPADTDDLDSNQEVIEAGAGGD